MVFVGVLTIVGCKSRCDPDEIFETDIVGSGWLECGDLHTEADRIEATTCLEEALDGGVPAYVRLSDDRGVQYLYLDEPGLAGVLGWGGRLGRMGDAVQHYHPCDAATAIDAFASREPINAECSGSGEKLCP
ncbi:MAG: hypothetical protein R6X02_27700 [Enhygromyxa sp.]